MPRFTPCIRLCLILAFVGALAVTPLQAQPPAPTVVLKEMPMGALIGETFKFRVEVLPHPTVIGYGPFLEIYLPYQGADCTKEGERCDGISFVSAEAIFEVTRVPLSPCPTGLIKYVSGSTCETPNPQQCLGTTAEAPKSCFFGLAPSVCTLSPSGFPAGYQKVVLELPVGSFVPKQAPILVEVTAKVDSFADPGFPLFISFRGGFRFGTEGKGGKPTADQKCPMPGWKMTPTVAIVKKSYDGPEDETATGPNFPRRYKISVDIAKDQMLNALKIIDCLPGNLKFDKTISLGICNAPTFNPSACPGEGFEIECPSVTGTDSSVDLEMTFQFHIPEEDLNGQEVLSSCTVESVNDVKLEGEWSSPDPRDTPPAVPFSSDVTDADHRLADRCIAIQKKYALLSDLGANGPTPDDTVRYTLEFQVSDFRTIRDIVVDDYLSDGQSFVPGSATIEIHDKFGVIAKSPFTDVLLSPSPGSHVCSDGRQMHNPQLLSFAVSQQLASLSPELRHVQGILTGGLAGLPTAGATIGTITFDAKIDDEFQRQDPALESFVDMDDELLNCVEIRGEVLANADAPATPSPTGEPASDISHQRFTIVHGTVRKTVYAINGDTNVPKPVRVNPGDEVTFRIEYTIPSGDAEDFYIEDYLPLPVFRTSQLKFACMAPPPPAETVTIAGPLCSVATFTQGSPENAFKLSFGDLSSTVNAEVKVDVYFTTQVTKEPFADGLVLSNHVLEHAKNTFRKDFPQTEIVPVIVGEPKLRIRKGVVSSNKATAIFSPPLPVPPPPSPFTFALPKTPGPAFTGTINSSNVGTPPLFSDLSGVDGCDLVKYAIVIENLGSSTKGAFDVKLRDLVPTCLGSVSNLQVRRGNGAPFTCNGGQSCPSQLGAFLGAGITLDDATGTGALAFYNANAGTNIAVVTFDAQIGCKVAATGCCTNEARLVNYAGIEGGPNHVNTGFSTPFPGASGAFSDEARVCVQPSLAKSIVTTSEGHTGNSGGVEQLAIGETVTYKLEVTVPEGTSPGMTVKDTLPPGLQWLAGSCKITKSSLLVNTPSQNLVLSGPSLTLSLGNVTNSANDPVAEKLTIVCKALVLDHPANVKPIPKPNSFSVQIGQPSATFTSNTVPAVIVEPMGAVTKEELPSASLGTATYVLGFTNTGTAAAFDVTLVDNLPAPLTVQGAVTPSAGCSVAPTPSNQVRVTCAMVPAGASVKVQFNATGVPLCKALPNTARLDYSSLPGPNAAERVYSSTASVTTTRCPDLTVTKSHLGDFHQGQSGTYTLTVKNTGNAPSVAPDVVKDSLPAGLFFLSGGGNGWTCASTNGQDVTCTNGTSIPPGGSSSFTITAIVTCGPSTIENCADVSTATEINLANNRSCDPAKVTKADPCEIAAVAAGGTHSLALRSDGTVLSWGARGKGPFDTTVPSSPVPARVGGLTGIFRIAGGGAHSLALRQGGTVWAWGNNDYGQLGDGTHTTSRIPVQVTGLTNVVAIAAGGYHSLALKGDGTLWAWGRNDYGQLGNGSTAGADVPVQISGLTGIKAFAAGLDHSMVVRSDGSVLAWGKNDFGQLGNGSTAVFSTSHVQVRGPGGAGFLTGIVSIAGGYNHSLAIRSDGTVWAWGSNELGKLGNGTAADSRVPVQVKTPAGGVFVEVAAGRHHSIALRKDRTVWTWGGNTFGQLGIGGLPSSSSVPLVVSGVFDTTAIAAGGVHSLALEIFGTGVHAWGFNASGQLGSGTTATSKVPVKVPIESLCPACGCPACGTCGP